MIIKKKLKSLEWYKFGKSAEFCR